MNPYVSNPDDIPASDKYADVPFYGRYSPRSDDFQVDLQHVNSQSEDSLQYWASVIALCNESIRIYPADEGGRDVFALGSVIVKSSHLHKTKYGRHSEIDYSYADSNEVQAVAIAKSVLESIKVPEIYFAGQVLTLFFIHFPLGVVSRSYLIYGHVFITDITADQWLPSTGTREAPRRWVERCMAIPIASPEGVLQATGTGGAWKVAHHQAS